MFWTQTPFSLAAIPFRFGTKSREGTWPFSHNMQRGLPISSSRSQGFRIIPSRVSCPRDQRLCCSIIGVAGDRFQRDTIIGGNEHGYAYNDMLGISDLKWFTVELVSDTTVVIRSAGLDQLIYDGSQVGFGGKRWCSKLGIS